MQDDGDLAIYSKGKKIWSAMSAGNDIDGLYFYSNGNLAVVRNDGSYAWSTDTHAIPNTPKPSEMTLRDEGNLILSTPSGQVIWNTYSDKQCRCPTGKLLFYEKTQI